VIVRRNALQGIDFDGLRIYDYTARIESGASLAFIEVPPGARHAEAWSKRSDKYYLVTRGSIRFVVEGESADLESGDFCLVSCGQRFSYSNEQSEIATLVLVHTPSFRLEDDVFERGA
jgi:mannose-6-phosphate isomerase-like protein (cupin superfamily)